MRYVPSNLTWVTSPLASRELFRDSTGNERESALVHAAAPIGANRLARTLRAPFALQFAGPDPCRRYYLVSILIMSRRFDRRGGTTVTRILLAAAQAAVKLAAQTSITVHLREDRRHIQPTAT